MARASSQQRRAQIVEAMLTVMASTGYEGASIQRIAAEAGLSPGLLHYHFPDKQAMLLALLQTLQERLEARHARLRTEASTPHAKINAWIDAHLARGEGEDSRAVSCWVQIGAEALRQPAVKARYAQALQADTAALRPAVAAALAQTGRPPADAAAIAAALQAAVEGAYLLALASPGLIPRGTAAEMVRRMAAGLLDR